MNYQYFVIKNKILNEKNCFGVFYSQKQIKLYQEFVTSHSNYDCTMYIVHSQ